MGLEDHERSVVELRARAGALIAAAAITTSFFGGETLVKHDISAAAWIVIGCFVLLGFALHLIERDLALHMGRSAELNRRQLRALMGVFRVGAVLLVVEVLAWVVALVVQR